jgi:flagellar hook protein FlgE
MSLASVLQTALSGMSAATMTVDVAANNLANSQTAGFKAGRAIFVSQSPATRSGGGNTVQTGTGVRAAAVAADYSQGPVVASSNPLDLALQGDGLFMVEGPSGERSYTRAGQFQLNAAGEIVTPSGQRLLGLGVDDQFQVGGELQPLAIRLGSLATSADGTAATLTSFSVGEDGRVRGAFSDGISRDLGQIRVARFANPQGLEGGGDNLLQAGANSGLPIEANPGSDGTATIMAGAVELSNTDVGQSLIELSLAEQQFRASANVFRTADSLLDELLLLRRGG